MRSCIMYMYTKFIAGMHVRLDVLSIILGKKNNTLMIVP